MTTEHVAALVSTLIDLAGIAALVIGAVLAFLLAGKTLVGTKDAAVAYRGLRRSLGKAILVGLELLGRFRELLVKEQEGGIECRYGTTLHRTRISADARPAQ
jgi:hypothetical protein